MRYQRTSLGLVRLFLGAALVVGCAQSADDMGGARSSMGGGTGVELQNATLSDLACIATPDKTQYLSGETMTIEVVMLNPVLPVRIPSWTDWMSQTTYDLTGSITNDTDEPMTVNKEVAVWDRYGSATCSFSVDILPDGSAPFTE